jgi:hypothetical protein
VSVLRQAVAGFSLWRARFDLKVVHERFVMDTTLAKLFS